MYRTTISITTLAAALVLAVSVSNGSLAAVDFEGAESTASIAPSTATSSTFEPQPTEEPSVAPSPEATQFAASADPSTVEEPGATEGPTAVVTSSSASTGVVARSQSTTTSVPLAAPPASFVTASPSPSAPACAAAITGQTPGAPARISPLGVAGTTSADLQSFAERYNALRVEQCLPPVPFANIRYDSCMEDRLFWMAEDPSTDPMSAWGHIGSVRSDGLPSVGCDGNLAGGSNNTGATVAQKWWDSTGHRTSLYKPTYTGSTSTVCILFAMTHGGVPDEPYSFVRSAARWAEC